MQRLLLSSLALGLALGCAGNSERRSQTAPPPILSLDPPAPMKDGDAQTLTAHLANGEGLHLAWRAQQGTISASGVYTAPDATVRFAAAIELVDTLP